MNATRALLFSSAVSCAVLFAACAGTESSTDEDDDKGNRPLPAIDGGTGKDAGKPATPGKDASADAAKDSSVADAADEDDASSDAAAPTDGGPSLFQPEPGTACTTVGERFVRPCDPCGTQIALCSPNRTVSGYGACRSADGACTPGSTEQGTACGACGTTTRVCNDQCVFEDGACEGEIAGGCIAGTTEQRLGSCATGQTIVYECSAACAWDVQSGASCTGTPAFPLITISSTEGQSVTRAVTAAEQVAGPRNFYDRCNALSAQTVYGRIFEVLNPTAQPAVVDVWTTGLSSQWDLVMIAYGSAPLATADLIPACLAVNDVCNVAPYRDTSDVCFAGANAVRIPANGRRWVYVGNFSSAAAAQALTLNLKTVDLE